MFRHAIGLAALFWVATAAAQVYKWVDASGVTHYSQTPPPAGDAKTIAVPQSPAGEAEGKPAGPSASGEAKPQPGQTVFTNEDERRKAHCEQARQELRTLEAPGQRVVRKNDQGEEVLLSGEERMTAVQAAKELEKTWCPAAAPQPQPQ